MTQVDARAGLDRALASTTNRPGFCLWEWWQKLGAFSAPHNYPTAMDAWNESSGKHLSDGHDAPVGSLLFYGPSPTRTDGNRNAGDVVGVMGSGLVRVTDGPTMGRWGTMTIEARSRQVRRPVLGWVDVFMGAELVNLGYPPAPLPGGTAGGLSDWNWRGVLRMLHAVGLYPKSLPITSNPLSEEWKALQRFLNKYGYAHRVFGRTIAEDGIPGTETYKALQAWLKYRAGGVSSLVIDGLPGSITHAAWDRAESQNYVAYMNADPAL